MFVDRCVDRCQPRRLRRFVVGAFRDRAAELVEQCFDARLAS